MLIGDEFLFLGEGFGHGFMDESPFVAGDFLNNLFYFGDLTGVLIARSTSARSKLFESFRLLNNFFYIC